MDKFSMADEVRFRTSPVIIDDTAPQVRRAQEWAKTTGKYNSAAAAASVPLPRRPRPQAVVNKQGLIELDLGHRGLREIPAEVYAQVRLESLRVDNNAIRAIPSAVTRLHKLRVLAAHHNQVVRLPDTLANCVHLHEVDVSHNRLTSVPRSLGLLRFLKVLKLAHNELEALPHEVGDLVALKQLDLAHNKLWHLPHSFKRLHNLHYLNLSENSFDQVPLMVCSMASLEALDMHGNLLLTLPPDFSSVHQLKELSLAHNRLDAVPPALLHLKHLHSLDLSYNKIRSLPPRLGDTLPALRMLVVQGNAIPDVPPNVTEAIQYLNIAENRVENFSVVKMRNLRYLNANSNVLENMPLGVYNLPHLEVLKLNTNRIAYLSQDIILLKKLKVLDLGNNKLTSLPQVIDELEHLETFNVKGNKIEARPQPLPYDPYYVPQSSLPRPNGLVPGGNAGYATMPQQNGAVPGHNAYNHGIRRRRSDRGNKKKTIVTSSKTPWKRKKPFANKRGKSKSTQHNPQSQNTATQITPMSTVRKRGRLPLDYNPNQQIQQRSGENNSSERDRSYVHAQPPGHQPGFAATSNGRGDSSGSAHHPAEIMKSNPMSVSEICYPMVSTPVPMKPSDDDDDKNPRGGGQSMLGVVPHQHNGHASAQHQHSPRSHRESSSPRPRSQAASYTQDWVWDKRQRHRSGSSNDVTVNGSIGDNQSLGEEDFEFQPTNIPDQKLMALCKETEVLLNKQLLQPLLSSGTKGIFRKSINEDGTLKTLHGISGEKDTFSDHDQSHNATLPPSTHDSSTIHMSKDIYLKRAHGTYNDNGILRMKMDIFRVTPSGGLFKSSVDPNISLYFPSNAVDTAIAVTLQIERISPSAIEEAKQYNPYLHNVLAVGDVVHIKQSKEMDFNEQVTVTIPAPPIAHKGHLHILNYRDDNSCTPCASQYRMKQGYISLHTWHFSGKGAVLTKSKCKYKACKTMEQLLHQLYI